MLKPDQDTHFDKLSSAIITASKLMHFMRDIMQQEQSILPVGFTVRDPAGGSYVVEELLGEGGFGAVYLVRDRRAKRLFALKDVIDPDRHSQERFTFEGEVLKRLSHRALPRVYRVFEHEKLKRVFLLMDYIEGQDLEALQPKQPAGQIALPLALALLDSIADALSYLHRQNPPIVHRDVKPANIIVPTRGDGAVLVDFGTAKEYVANRTTTAIRHGSPGYAAPEQYGRGTTPRTDLYGLGATLYTLLTGTIPPDSITRATTSRGVDPLEPAYLIAPGIPWEVAAAIERAMSISPDDRFETVEEFWQEVTAHAPQRQVFLTSSTSTSMPQPLPVLPEHERGRMTPAPHRQRHAPRVSRRAALLSFALALLFSVAIGASFLAVLIRDDGPSFAVQKVTSPPPHAPSIPPSKVTSAVSPASTPPRGSPIYPSLTASYAGTVVDLLNNEKTNLFLTQVQQSQGSIRGSFQGLGLVGPFTGTVTSTGQVQFTVKVYSGDETLVFEGNIKIGGDMVGSFVVLDRQGNRTGEVGLWNVAANS